MDQPIAVLLNQMKTKKFAREDDMIRVHLFSDVNIMKLVRVAIALAVGLEIIDKLSPTVKCFPIGRTFFKKPGSVNSIYYVSSYNYQEFLSFYCETAISDYSKFKAYLAWKATCPPPAGNATKATSCSSDLMQANNPEVQTCAHSGPESIMEILKSKRTKFRDLINYIFVSIAKSDQLYDCRPRTLYYYVMSWSLLVFALMIGMGPSIWNFLFGEKIADRIRHIKAFVDTVVDEDEEKKEEMETILREEVRRWDSTIMSVVAYLKFILTIVVSLVAIATFVRGFRSDIEDLGLTVCKVHDYEYARCASPRVGLIWFVWWAALAVLILILFMSIFNLSSLISLTCKRTREAGSTRNKMFLPTLLKDHLGSNVFNENKIKYCFSDLMILAVLCEKNRQLFGAGWRRFNKERTLTSRLRMRIAGVTASRESEF